MSNRRELSDHFNGRKCTARLCRESYGTARHGNCSVPVNAAPRRVTIRVAFEHRRGNRGATSGGREFLAAAVVLGGVICDAKNSRPRFCRNASTGYPQSAPEKNRCFWGPGRRFSVRGC